MEQKDEEDSLKGAKAWEEHMAYFDDLCVGCFFYNDSEMCCGCDGCEMYEKWKPKWKDDEKDGEHDG